MIVQFVLIYKTCDTEYDSIIKSKIKSLILIN